MYIIIVGLGKLGSTLTKQLSTEGHDIVVVDPDNSVVSSTVDAYDVMGICGNGATYEVLKEAGAAKAKLIIAATGSDELNILCCLFAKHMGTENTIARVRNPDYAGQSQFLRNDLGISMTVNPEYETANEISRIIRFPSAANLDSFAGGRVEIARVRIHSDNPLCDMPIHEIRKKTKAKVIICAVQRNDSVFIPSGDFVLHCDDVISITGTRAELSSFMKQTGVYKQKIKNVMIVGGGRIAYYLAKLLSDTGRNIKLIELKDERCRHMSDMLDDVTVIHGDGTDQDILEEQCIDGQDALIALTGIDEENIIVSMYAESKGVNKVITKVNRHSYSILNDIGLETVVTVDPLKLDEAIEAVKAVTAEPGVKAIIFKSPCVAITKPSGRSVIDPEKCTGCKSCIRKLGCPGIIIRDGKVTIDETLCTGCGICGCVCPFGAISGGEKA